MNAYTASFCDADDIVIEDVAVDADDLAEAMVMAMANIPVGSCNLYLFADRGDQE